MPPKLLRQDNMLRVTFLLAMFALLIGCSSNNSQPNVSDSSPSNSASSNDQEERPIDKSNIAKVKVLADGTILLNERQVTIDKLKTTFTTLKDQNGVVWYYRGNAAGETPQQAMLVM